MHKSFRFRSHFLVDFLLLLPLLCISARAQQVGELDTGFIVKNVGMQMARSCRSSWMTACPRVCICYKYGMDKRPEATR